MTSENRHEHEVRVPPEGAERRAFRSSAWRRSPSYSRRAAWLAAKCGSCQRSGNGAGTGCGEPRIRGRVNYGRGRSIDCLRS
jgi:hypothetical protein